MLMPESSASSYRQARRLRRVTRLEYGVTDKAVFRLVRLRQAEAARRDNLEPAVQKAVDFARLARIVGGGDQFLAGNKRNRHEHSPFADCLT